MLDFGISFMWVWSSVLIKILVYKAVGFDVHDVKAEILKHSLSVGNMFFFAYLVKHAKGGAYNPLTLLSSAVTGDFSQFLFTVGARIPAQVTNSFYFYTKFLTVNNNNSNIPSNMTEGFSVSISICKIIGFP